MTVLPGTTLAGTTLAGTTLAGTTLARTAAAVAVAFAVAGAAASPAAAAPPTRPTVALSSDSFTVCPWPGNCAAASISGRVNWTTGSLNALITNNGYVWVRAAFGAVQSGPFPRGVRTVVLQIPAAQTSVRVTLCVPPTLMPNPCTSADVVRPNS
jgi:hypothetical protein